MTRTRTLDALVPLAAGEPDGLLTTTDGGYVRLLEASEVLQPLHGGPARREQIRQRLAGLAGRVPAGHGLQVIVEAEPLDPGHALAGDWRHVGAAAIAARRRGDDQLAAAMR